MDQPGEVNRADFEVADTSEIAGNPSSNPVARPDLHQTEIPVKFRLRIKLMVAENGPSLGGHQNFLPKTSTTRE